MVRTRREFMADVGRGMLIASVGPALAADLGLASAYADQAGDRITFGALEPLVSLMEETPVAKLLPALVEKLQGGTDLKTLVAAGALANARKFGGHDYNGYHTFMALSPALEMSRELPEDRRALPVLKVLYRNTTLMQQQGGKNNERLHHVHAGELPEGKSGSELLFEAMKKPDMAQADSTFAALAEPPADAYNDLQFIVQDQVDVHRVVLAWRAWSLLDVTGKEQAQTLLRQSVHFCVEAEQRRVQQKHGEPAIRALLPKLLDQYKLAGKAIGDRKADDAWIDKFSQIIFASKRKQAADAVAAALAEGMSPESIGEAMSLAANRLLLCDGGRDEAIGTKSKYSVHGDSVGLHASDAANAWRNIARVSKPRNVIASLIVGAFHTAGQAGRSHKDPYPLAAHLEEIKTKDADALLRETETAIKAGAQAMVCALVHRYGELGHPPRPVFDLLLKYACSEDGALHAEKYYRTVSEEFGTIRPAFRWRELVALARVTASEYGQPAPGYADACRLLKV